jgi:hypothetical protein
VSLETPNFRKFLFGGNVRYQWVVVTKTRKSVSRDASHGLRLAVLIQDFAAEKTECPEIDSGKWKGRGATDERSLGLMAPWVNAAQFRQFDISGPIKLRPSSRQDIDVRSAEKGLCITSQ